MTTRRRRRACAYTLIEMVVVCVVVMLVIALVTPRFIGGSKRFSAEQALSQFREAFGETAMRARANGKPLKLTLDENRKNFVVTELTSPWDKDWHPPVLPPLTGQEGGAAILPGAPSYPVPDGVEWTELPDTDGDPQGIAYTFFPDGEAAGPAIAWEMFGRSYKLIVDSVLGKATILEAEE